MSPFGRFDVIVLALMLIYVFAVIIHVCCRYYLARHARADDSACRRKLAAFLSSEMRSLKSIALTAPYLGLAGTCVGLLNAFSGVAMARYTAMVLIATRIAVALITTAAGIPVAVLATCSHNYLRTRIDLLESELFDEGQQGDRHFRGTRRFPPPKRFSELPAFGLVAAPGLAIVITGYMTFASFHPPTGLHVKLLAHTSSSECGDSDIIVLQLLNDHSFRINSERVSIENLGGRLREIFRPRAERILLVRADPEISFQEVVTSIGIAEGVVSNLYVALLTPEAEKEPCLYITMPRELPKLPQ
jgi:biopolymer transport protein ExbD